MRKLHGVSNQFAQVVLWAVAAILTLNALSLPSEAEVEVEIILDASSSMLKMSAGKQRIQMAKEALRQALSELPGDARLAFRAYGHRISQRDKNASCKDTELLVESGIGNQKRIETEALRLTPRGFTPLAHALESARSDFSASTERTIILLSDGSDTCGGDPAAVMERLRLEGFDVRVLPIGFLVDADARDQLNKVARISGGTYLEAKTKHGLHSALKKALGAAVSGSDLIPGDLGAETDAGSSLGQALLVTPGVYPKNFLGRKDDSDLFRIEAVEGEKYLVEIKCPQDFRAGMKLAIVDRSSKDLIENTLCNGISVRSDVFTIPKKDQYYLRISLNGLSDQNVGYGFELKKLVDFGG